MATSQTLAPGALLYDGDYRIIRVLGRGGFGITYLAENVNLEKLVAIKEFFPRGMYNREEKTGYASVGSRDNVDIAEKFKKKFLKEARRLARLHDDSIVAVSNAFEENGTAYYVMDFIEGNDLQTIVREGGIMSVDRAIRYISQVGAALIYLHERRINHLDVKPANILVDPAKNRAVLIDFGLSKQYDENDRQTSTTPVGVSHGYAPNEQYNPGGVKDFSAPTDVYALGATLYFLLTGERPPTASELSENPLDFPSSFPDQLRPVILKAMAYRRSDRYQSVSDFLAALVGSGYSRTIFDDRPSEVSEVEVVAPSKKRRRWLIPVLISALVLIAGVSAFFILKSSDDFIESEEQTLVYGEDSTEVSDADALIAKINACKTLEELEALGTEAAKFQNDPNALEEIMKAGQAKAMEFEAEASSADDEILAAEELESETEDKINMYAYFHYKGEIGPYSIDLSIHREGYSDSRINLSGSYYYTRYSSDNKMYLRGYQYDEKIILEEYNSKNEYCGRFDLVEEASGALYGTFESYVNQKQFDVTLYPQ